MKETITTYRVTCDNCQAVLPENWPALGECHYCKKCCELMEDYTARVLRNEIKGRRGVRKIGDLDT